MKKIAIFVAMGCGLSAASLALAEDADPAIAPAAETPAVAPAAPDCAAQATDKRLAGAALSSFLKKCERDAATSACDAAAAEKKLKGAAKASFTRKCVTDATAAPKPQ